MKPLPYARVYCDEPNPRLHRAAANWSALMLTEAYRAARGAARVPFRMVRGLWRGLVERWKYPSPAEVRRSDIADAAVIWACIAGVVALFAFACWQSSQASPESSYSHVVVEVGE